MPPESHTRSLCSLSPTSSRIPWLHLTRSTPPHRAPSSHGLCSPPGRIPASYTPTWQRSSLVLKLESARISQLVCDDIVDVGERSREGWAERDGGGCDSLGYGREKGPGQAAGAECSRSWGAEGPGAAGLALGVREEGAAPNHRAGYRIRPIDWLWNVLTNRFLACRWQVEVIWTNFGGSKKRTMETLFALLLGRDYSV
jgi:hypothetical protein